MTRSHQNPAAHVNTSGRQNGLGQVFVHGDCRGGDTAADVARSSHLKETLNGAILAIGAVQERKNDVDVTQILHTDDAGVASIRVAIVGEFNEVTFAGGQGDAGGSSSNRLSFPILECQGRRIVGNTHPLAIARNSQGDHIPLGAVDGGEDTGGSRTGDFVL